MSAPTDLAVFDRELRDWLPPRLLDFHVHLVHRQSFPPGFVPPPRSYQHRLRDGSYLLEDALGDAAAFLPGREFALVGFGSPSHDPDREHANRYVAGVCDGQRVFGLALVSPADPVERVESWLRTTPLLGYKPYRDFVQGKPREQVSIPDMLPDAHMALADRLGLMVMLHIPRAGRLADPANQREILDLADRWPHARIVLAHVGRAYALATVVGHLDRIRERPNLYVDLAMLNHWEVLEYVFREFPRERILFGSDLPIARLRGKSVEINDQYAYLTELDVDVGSAIHDAHGAVRFTFFYYEELRAMRKAAERAGLSRAEVEGIFWDNGMRLLAGAATSRARGLGDQA